jgi:hypothetical protein
MLENPDYLRKLRTLLSKGRTEIQIEIFDIAEKFDISESQVNKDFFTLIETELKSKVEELYNSGLTAFERAYKKEEIDAWLSLTIRDKVERAKVFAQYYTDKEEIEIYDDFQELLKSKKNKKDFLVSELIMRGSLLLIVGYGKTGKTRFVTSLCAALSTGSNFLGRKTRKSKILFLQNEDTVENAATLYYYAGLQVLEKKDYQEYLKVVTKGNIVFGTKADIGYDLEKIFEIVVEREIDFLVVDSLGASLKKSGLTEQSTEIAPILYAFQAKVKEHNISAIIIHHATKGQKDATNSEGRLTSVAGSNVIVRANDGLLHLSSAKDPKDKSGLILYGTVRHAPPFEYNLNVTEGTGLYTEYEIKTDNSRRPELLAIQNQIVRICQARKEMWLESYGNKIETDDFRHLPPDVPQVWGASKLELLKEIKCTLEEFNEVSNWMLIVKGIQYRVEKNDDFFYFGEREDSWLLSFVYKEDKDKQQEQADKSTLLNLVAKLIVLTTLEAIKELTKEWKNDLKQQVIEMMTDEQYQQFMSIVQPAKYSEGDDITYKKQQYFIENTFFDKEKKVRMYTFCDSSLVVSEKDLP